MTAGRKTTLERMKIKMTERSRMTWRGQGQCFSAGRGFGSPLFDSQLTGERWRKSDITDDMFILSSLIFALSSMYILVTKNTKIHMPLSLSFINNIHVPLEDLL